jgi:hypothetical protein
MCPIHGRVHKRSNKAILKTKRFIMCFKDNKKMYFDCEDDTQHICKLTNVNYEDDLPVT